MTEKQRFLVYVHFAGLLAYVRKNKGISISESIKILLDNGVIQQLEDLETGYYLESDGYLVNSFSIQKLSILPHI